MKNHGYVYFFPFYPKLNRSHVKKIMLTHTAAKFTPNRTNFFKTLKIFLHRTTAHRALYQSKNFLSKLEANVFSLTLVSLVLRSNEIQHRILVRLGRIVKQMTRHKETK